MRKFTKFSSNTPKNKYNNTSINTQNSKIEEIKNILVTRSLVKKDLVLKSIKKRKKLIEKFIPKNEVFYSNYKDYNKKQNKIKKIEKKKDKKNEDDKNKEELTIPFRNKIMNFQNQLNNNNTNLKNISEENKLFHDRYKLSLQQKKENKKKINLELSEKAVNYDINDFYNNNIFNQSLLLTKQRRIPDYILKSLNNNESKEDLKIIENLKKHFTKGKTIEYPEFLIKDKVEKIKLYKSIKQMKQENKALEDNITKYEKTGVIIDDLDLTSDKRKELNILNQKLSSIQNNISKKDITLRLNSPKEKELDKNIQNKILVSPEDNKGEYKLVTKCIFKDNKSKILNPRKRTELSKTYNKKIKLKDFVTNYNKTKDLIGMTRKGQFSSNVINFNLFNSKSTKRSVKRKLLKSKILFNRKNFDSLSSCLESFAEKNVKEKDIFNLYSFMKKESYFKINDLLSFYKDKYGKTYEAENIEKNLPKRREKYNIVKKMYELDELNNFNKGNDDKERENLLNNVKELDEQLENNGILFMKRIVNFN